MMITFHLWGPLRNAARRSTIALEIDDCADLRKATLKLANLNEELKRSLLTESGQFHSSNIAVVEGEKRNWNDKTPLIDGANISLMAPIGGG